MSCNIISRHNHLILLPISLFLAFLAADGKYCLTVGHDKKIILWNPSRLDPAHSTAYSLPLINEHSVGTNDDVDISKLPRALPIQTYEDGIRYTPTALHINTDSTRLLVGSDKTAVLIDCITKKVLRQFHHHTAVINSVSMFMSTGVDQVYATASYDATVCLWDARSSNTYRPIQVLKDAKDSVTAVNICSSSNEDDAIIRTASVDGIVRTYDIRRGMLQCDNYGSPVVSIATTKCDSLSYFAASCLDGSIRVTNEACDWNRNVVTGNATLSTKPMICRDGHVAGRYALECCFLANGTSLLTGSENGSAVLYGIKTVEYERNIDTTNHESRGTMIAPKVVEYSGHTAPTCAVAAHPKKSDVIITASYDGNCTVWSNNNPNEYFQ